MSRYFVSRLIVVFLLNFFLSVSLHSKSQLIQFFNIPNGFELNLLSCLVTFVSIIIGLITITLIFSPLNYKKLISIYSNRENLNSPNRPNSFLIYLGFFPALLIENFRIEAKNEKAPNLFLIFIIFFLPFSKGNPIFNNYYGIYREYEEEYREQTGYSEEPKFIINKNNINEINEIIENTENNPEENEKYFEVKKRGYLFLEAGLIDGYKPFTGQFNGYFAYLKCIMYNAIEKFVNTILYFLLPFIILFYIKEKYVKVG